MNYDRMRKLAGLEPITEAAKAKGPPKKYKATYDGKTIEIMAADANEAKQKAVDVKGLSVPMTQWGKVSVELAEGAVNDNMSRHGLKDPTDDYQSPARLYGLYVGLRGDGKLHIQFTGDRSECLSQWHDDLKRGYKRGEAVARVVPLPDQSNVPNVIAESFECEDYEDIVMEGANKPDDSSRCENCDAKIDPKNYDSTSHGFLCVECGDARRDTQDAYPNESVDDADKAPVLDTKVENQTSTVKVPTDVTAAINSRIAELKKSIAEFNDKGYDDGGVKPNTIDALEQIAADLKLEDGLTKANIFYGTLMSPITDLFPPKVVKFLHTAPVKKVTESTDDVISVTAAASILGVAESRVAQLIADGKLESATYVGDDGERYKGVVRSSLPS